MHGDVASGLNSRHVSIFGPILLETALKDAQTERNFRLSHPNESSTQTEWREAQVKELKKAEEEKNRFRSLLNSGRNKKHWKWRMFSMEESLYERRFERNAWLQTFVHCGNSGITLLSAITELSLSSNEWIPKPRPVNQSTTMRFHILRTFEGLFGNWASSCCSAVRGILKVLENWRMAKLMKFKLCVEWFRV